MTYALNKGMVQREDFEIRQSTTLLTTLNFLAVEQKATIKAHVGKVKVFDKKKKPSFVFFT